MAQLLDQTNVFVKYLPSELDDEGLRELFSPFGEIVSSKVMVDHQTKTSLGYGFVRFTRPEDTQQAITKLSGHRVGNKVLLCKLSNSSPSIVAPEISTNLYIKPLHPETTEETLTKLFGEFGPIAAAKVMVDKLTGESRQIGFVRYENQEDATKALNVMNGRQIDESQGPLIVKYAETENQRSARKTRTIQTTSTYSSTSPPVSPTGGPTYYYPPSPMAMYSQIQYMPVPIAAPTPYNHYMTMLFSPQNSGYSPVWRPPYVVATEQMMSY